jgi:hypothetical protein
MLRAKLKQHILDICRQQEIQVEWRRSSRGGWAVHEFDLSAFRRSRARSRMPLRFTKSAMC